MVDSLFSSSWYRVAQLRPQLRGHTQIHRHSYRDEVWFILEDQVSGKFHRFSEGANQVIGLMDGRRTVDEIWQLATEELGDDSPTQEEMIRLLAQLHAADVLQSEATPDSVELFARYQRQARARLKQRVWSPLALRFKLFDPERFLTRTLPVVRPLFSVAGFCLWLLLVAAGVVLAAMQWGELTNDIADRVLAPRNFLLLGLIYPVVKAFHELGHAYATKIWGGEVHEIGVMLLVFMPVPYVDASAASAFGARHRRMIVGAMGIMVELLLAAIALFVWTNAEYGMVRAIAYNVMLIGGVSTLFFNGNPLLRFDGYYVFSDWLEMPNLAKRANEYLGYLVQRYAFRSENATSPVSSHTEAKWFVIYGLASFAYRMFIAAFILLLVAGKFFFIGVILACWAAFTMLVLPLYRMLKFVVTSPKLADQRTRAIGLVGAFASIVVLTLVAIPAPQRTMAEGVVWLPERSSIRAGTACFVESVAATPDAVVEAGEVLIRCSDPLLPSRARSLEARLRELRALYESQRRDDRVAAGITQEEIEAVQADLADLNERIDALLIRSRVGGRFIVPRIHDLPGRFAHQGEVLGYVIEPEAMRVKVAVMEGDVGMVRGDTQFVLAQLADRRGQSIPAEIVREVPGGTNQLPSPVLAKAGGGAIDVDPRDPDQRATIMRLFEYDLVLPSDLPRAPAGTRVYVRFGHSDAPLAVQWYRRLRQVFLSRFGI